VPPALDDVIIRGLSRDAGHRFDDVRELGRALLGFADPKTARLWEKDFAQPSRKWATVGSQDADTDTDTMVHATPPPPPPMPSPPGTSTLYIKGVAYRGIVRLVERKVPGGLTALDEEMADPGLSAFVRQPFLPASRYDILPILPLNVAIARLLGKALEELAYEQGIAQARFDARYVYKRIFDAASGDALPDGLARLVGQYYDTGEATAEQPDPGHIVLRRKRLPAYVLPWFAPVQAAYAEEIVRLKGARIVESATREPMDAGKRRGIDMVDLDLDVRWK